MAAVLGAFGGVLYWTGRRIRTGQRRYIRRATTGAWVALIIVLVSVAARLFSLFADTSIDMRERNVTFTMLLIVLGLYSAALVSAIRALRDRDLRALPWRDDAPSGEKD